ncbi:metallocarboxypeptidase ecm14 [Apiospora arundinis]|uniref:Inactive metallocarboxypeptidase ECM14 n=1 Tax=Apiospora arundinis TaxID=335852 RepID=A0ABR2I239_9PEZI
MRLHFLDTFPVIALLIATSLSHPHDPPVSGASPPRWLRESPVAAILDNPRSHDSNSPIRSAFSHVWGLDFWPFNSNQDAQWDDHRPKRHDMYKDDVVLRFSLSTPNDETALRQAAKGLNMDIWDSGPDFTDMRVAKDGIRRFLNILPESLQSAYTVLIDDLASAIAATYPPTSKSKGNAASKATRPKELRSHQPEGIFFRNYQPFETINTWLELLHSMFQGDLVEKFSIGKTAEGRDIPALRVGLGSSAGSGSRKTILITGGLHAREWISISTVNYLAWSFITSYGQDELVDRILDKYDIVFIPVVNPDGYEYTWTNDRLWRKTRQNTTMEYCPGVDLDHAFGYQWGPSESQTEPCSLTYGGEGPFHAVEAAQLAQWAKNETQNNNVNFIAYLDLHSYSQQILWPYAYSCSARVPNLENMMEVAMNIAKYMRLSSGDVYTVDSACEGEVATRSGAALGDDAVSNHQIEQAGGSALDYFFHDIKARYSYQIKLRDTGTYGFLLPPSHIVPTGQEMFQALKYFGDYLLGNNGHEWMQTAGNQQEL